MGTLKSSVRVGALCVIALASSCVGQEREEHETHAGRATAQDSVAPASRRDLRATAPAITPPDTAWASIRGPDGAMYIAQHSVDSASEERFTAIRRRTDGTTTELARHRLAPWEAYPVPTWISMGATTGPQLILAFEESGEGSTGTYIYDVSEDGAIVVFVDAGQACRPAQLIDIDHDSIPEIVSFKGSRSHCENVCTGGLRELGLGEPTWATLLAWDGHKWVEASGANRRFLDSLSVTYESLANALPRVNALLNCEGSAGVTLRARLREWSQLAAAMAKARS